MFCADNRAIVAISWAQRYTYCIKGAALPDTSGYDFGNQVKGDIYIFLLGNGLEGWWKARAEFLRLTGYGCVVSFWISKLIDSYVNFIVVVLHVFESLGCGIFPRFCLSHRRMQP